jgi:pyruvate-formate lyase
MSESVEEYTLRLRQRVGEAEYQRHRELVRLLARNLAVEDILWEEILEHIKDINLRNTLLKQRNQIVRDIHTEFRALNIEIPTIVEKKTESFMSFLGDLSDDEDSEKRNKETEESDIGQE